MSPELEYLDLSNNDWIPNDLTCKLGYFSPNLKVIISNS
jgi:hypothetical protein